MSFDEATEFARSHGYDLSVMFDATTGIWRAWITPQGSASSRAKRQGFGKSAVLTEALQLASTTIDRGR